MTRVLQQILRLATLLIGISATSVALAVATVEVTTTGLIRDSTTLQLDNIVGDHRYVFDKNKTSINMPAGTYTARVMYMGLPSGEPHTVTVTDGVINRLEYDGSGNVKELPPGPIMKPVGSVPGTQPSQFSISAGPGAVRRNGVAFGVDPVTEQRVVQTPDTTYAAAVDMTWRLSSGIQLSAGGMGGNRSNSAEVQIGQRASITFLNPKGLITGFGSNGGGQFGAKGEVLDLHVDSEFPGQMLKYEKDSRKLLSWYFGGGYSETKDHGTFNVIADPTIWSTTDLKMKEFYVHAGPELRGEHIFPNGLVGSVGVGVNAIYYHASLNANQAFVCPICSAAIQMVSGSASDSRNRLTFGALVSGGLSYPVSDKASILFRVSYDETWNAPRVFNKDNPNDPGAHLGTGNLGIASVQLGVSIEF